MPEENGETIIAYRPAWAGGVAVAVRWPWISRLIRHLPCLSRQSSCARSRRDCSFPRRVASQSRRLIEVHNDLGEEGCSSAASLPASFLLQPQLLCEDPDKRRTPSSTWTPGSSGSTIRCNRKGSKKNWRGAIDFERGKERRKIRACCTHRGRTGHLKAYILDDHEAAARQSPRLPSCGTEGVAFCIFLDCRETQRRLPPPPTASGGTAISGSTVLSVT